MILKSPLSGCSEWFIFIVMAGKGISLGLSLPFTFSNKFLEGGKKHKSAFSNQAWSWLELQWQIFKGCTDTRQIKVSKNFWNNISFKTTSALKQQTFFKTIDFSTYIYLVKN